MGNEINISNATAGAAINAQDTNNDGGVDKITIQTAEGESVKTGIYNVNTPEGRAAAKAALLDLGLTMPEFLTPQAEAQINNLMADAKISLQEFGKEVGKLISSGAGQTSGTGDSSAVTANLQGRWAEFMGKVATTGGMDVNALVQFVLREAYMENTKDLHFYAQKVRFYNELKKGIRDELTAARKFLSSQSTKCADWVKQDPDNRSSENAPIAYKDAAGVGLAKTFDTTPDYDGENGMVPKEAVGGSYTISNENGTQRDIATKGELETYIKGLEEKLNSVGDDAQLANVDLQNMLQKQQQTLQMMSNISKMLHDTAMAIIRKMGS